MTTTPSREDWEIEFSEKFWECDSIVFANERKRDAVIDFIRNLLQSHNNALVAEIEGLPAFSPGYDKVMGKVSDEAKVPRWGTNYLERETVIRIIQEK